MPGKATKARAFLSYDPRDIDRVQAFLDRHASVLPEPRTVGITRSDDLARWNDPAHIIDAVRQRYIGDAEVAIVLVGERTWTRRFVDWEIAASASHGCAVLAVPLGLGCAAPARVRLLAEEGSAVILQRPPSNPAELDGWIATALDARQRARANVHRRARDTPLMRRNAILQAH